MKTLVTGGAGFIASHLVKRLLKEGREVIIPDDLFKGSRQNLLDLGLDVELMSIDLRDYDQVSKLIRAAVHVFHLAGRVGNIEYLHGSEMSEFEALHTNLSIEIDVLRMLHKEHPDEHALEKAHIN